MDPLSIITLVGILATVVGGIITNSSNRRNVRNTNETNQQIAQDTNQAQSLLAQQQHAWNVSDWQRQAAYDAPAAQMQRFRDAGLNPALIYGQMSEGPSINSTEQPHMQMNRAQSFLAQNPLENLDPLSFAQMRNIEANTEYIESQTETENFMRQARYDNLVAATENLGKQNEEIVGRLQRMAKENEFTDAQIRQFRFDNIMRGKYFRLDSEKFKLESKLTDAQCRKLEADRQKALADAKVTNREYDEMVWTFAIRKAGLEKQVSLTDAQIAQANATARKLGVDADIVDWKAEGRRQKLSALQGEQGSFAKWEATILWSMEDIFSWMGSVLH